jgi:guanylate kinase
MDPSSQTPDLNQQRRGLMLVLSSPSGAGKTSVAKGLLTAEPDLTLSISMTTRPPRPGEADGKDYCFVSKESFQENVEKKTFLEHANVFGHYYGTPHQGVEDLLSSGRDVLFDIDWQGTQQIRQAARDDLVSIFLLPPSWRALEQRLKSRAQDDDAVIAKRMAKASSEISHWAEYDYVLINDDLEETIEKSRTILTAERLKRIRHPQLAHFVGSLHPS